MLHSISEFFEDDLSSQKGINYSFLQALLKAGEWKGADYHTQRVILIAAAKSPDTTLYTQDIINNDIAKIPCTDINTINRLWLKYSNGKFGYSVQKKIYYDCMSELNYKYSDDRLKTQKVWETFGDRIGWRKRYWLNEQGQELNLLNSETPNNDLRMYEHWISYGKVKFDLSSPPGHLPTEPFPFVECSGGFGSLNSGNGIRFWEALFLHMESCNI